MMNFKRAVFITRQLTNLSPACNGGRCPHINTSFKTGNQEFGPLTVHRRRLSDIANSVLAQTEIVTIPTAEIGVPVSVKAYYIARGVDIRRVESNLYGTSREQLHGKSVTITVEKKLNQFISIFEYGSCVFFNIPTAQHSEHLRRIREAAFVETNAGRFEHTEDYTVMIHDKLDRPFAIKPEHVNIRCLDSNNIVIIGTVVAQSVALDYYAATVEEKLDTFMRMNKNIEESANPNFDLMDKKELYKLVGFNNTATTNVLSKLGLFEGSDAAWENADYHSTLEALRKEFEIESRFNDISMKLDLVKDNARFFLEIDHNVKYSKLEWYVIILITVEIMITIPGHILNHYPNIGSSIGL